MVKPKTKKRRLLPIDQFITKESAGGILLFICAVVAIIWANSAWSGFYNELWQTPFAVAFGTAGLTKPIILWINDLLMAVFFLLVGLEIKRELLVGELSSFRDALLPLLAAVGGMVAPAIIYSIVNAGGDFARGWGTPMATDIAFSLGVMALLATRVPIALKIFLTALAIVDDLGAITVIGVVYTESLNIGALLSAAGIIALLALFNRMGFKALPFYLIPGLVLWYFFLKSGLHATIAGVLLAFTIPAKTGLDTESFYNRMKGFLDGFKNAGPPADQIISNLERQSQLHLMHKDIAAVESPLEKLEHALLPLVSFVIMPIFAIANAGVTLESVPGLTDPIFLGIVLGLFLGNPIGIVGLTWLGVRFGWVSLPENVTWQHILGAAFLAGIGFTMSLFIAGLAFPAGVPLQTAKFAVLIGSLLSGVTGALILYRTKPAT